MQGAEASEGPTVAALTGWAIFLVALWTGTATGVIEAFGAVAARSLLSRGPIVNPHALWMGPATYLVLFGVVGAGLALIARVRGGLSPRIVVGLLIALAGWALATLEMRADLGLVVGIGFGVHAGRVLGRDPARMYGRVRRSFPWLLGVVGAAAVGVVGAEWLQGRRATGGQGPLAGLPNVLLLVIDTGRARNMSVHGYEHPTTPRLERWGADGAVFDLAIAGSSWSLPAHGVMFTGRPASELSTGWGSGLDDSFPTLAEVLRDQGYATAGFVANLDYGVPAFGLSRGFQEYQSYGYGLGEFLLSTAPGRLAARSRGLRNLIGYHHALGHKSAADLNRDLLAWLDHRDEAPFFVFVNYFDVHQPLHPQEPWRGTFGPTTQARPDLLLWSTRTAWLPVHAELTPEERDAEVALYDAALATVDYDIDALLRALEGRGVLENTLLIVTADHGEQFGEHGMNDHGNSLYQEEIHVPLVLRFPKAIPHARIGEAVSLGRIPGTVLSILGLPAPGSFTGPSLEVYWTEGNSATVPPVIAYVEGGSGEWQAAVILERWKLIRRSQGTEELYHLAQDPLERENQIGSSPPETPLRALRAVLDSVRGLSLPE